MSFGNANDVVTTVEINKGVEKTVNGIFETSANVLIKKGMESSVVQNISINENLEAPILKGQKIGTATYTLNDETVATINIVAEKEVKKSTIFNITKNIYSEWFRMIR